MLRARSALAVHQCGICLMSAHAVRNTVRKRSLQASSGALESWADGVVVQICRQPALTVRHAMQGQQRWLSLLTGDDGAVVSHLVFIANNSLSDDLIAARWAAS